MAFIKVQKLARDKDGNITQGTASIVDTVYIADGKYHSKQVVREPLGKVLSLSEDKRNGIFLSQRRGLVHYDAEQDTFRMLSSGEKEALGLIGGRAQASLTFGDAYWYLQYLLHSGLMQVLKEAFPDETLREALLVRLLHKSLPSGRSTSCAGFLSSSFAGLLFPMQDKAGLADDTAFFSLLGREEYSTSFFLALHKYLQKTQPESCVLVKTAPLPWQSGAFSGTDRQENGSLCLVLARKSGIPVWFAISPDEGSVPTTAGSVPQMQDSPNQLQIASCILEAGSVSKDIVREFCSDKKDFIALMPARKDFQYKDAFKEHVRPYLGKAKFEFSLEGRRYFARQVPFSLYGRNVYITHFVDLEKARLRFKEYSTLYPNEVDDLGGFKKEWLASRFGYFALLSSAPLPEKELLGTYLGQSRRYEYFASLCHDCQPAARRGAILFASVQCLISQGIKSALAGHNTTPEEVFAAIQPLFCLPSDTDLCLTDTPSDKVRDCFAILGIAVPACVSPEKFRQELSGL